MSTSEMPPPPPPPGAAAPPPPPVPQYTPTSTAPEQPVAATPGEWRAMPVGGPPPVPSRSISTGWTIAALVGCVLSIIGAFLPLLSVGGRSLSRGDQIGIDVVVPWRFSDRFTGSLLLERWDVAAAMLVIGAIAAVLLLTVRRVWPAVIGALVAAFAFHVQLSMVQRAEARGLARMQSPSYEIGGILLVGGALLALVGFIIVLARRH